MPAGNFCYECLRTVEKRGLCEACWTKSRIETSLVESARIARRIRMKDLGDRIDAQPWPKHEVYEQRVDLTDYRELEKERNVLKHRLAKLEKEGPRIHLEPLPERVKVPKWDGTEKVYRVQRFVPITFLCNKNVDCGVQATLSTNLQIVFQPVFFVCSDEVRRAFILDDFKIGRDSQFAQYGRVPFLHFAYVLGENPPPPWTIGVGEVGHQLTLLATNVSEERHTLDMTIWGYRLDAELQPPPPPPSPPYWTDERKAKFARGRRGLSQ
jgi:hypothetical protein